MAKLRLLKAFLIPTLGFLVSGCAVGPDYLPPKHPTAEAFSQGRDPEMSNTPSLATWWEDFGDRQLNDLVFAAIAENRSLDAALARLNQARATRQLSFYDLLPTATASGAYAKIKDPSARIPAPGPVDLTRQVYVGAGDVSWEIDLFGRVRRQYEKSEAEEAGSLSDLQDLMRTVIADVATNYFTLRGDQASLQVARDNVLSQEKTVELLRAQAAGGVVSDLDVVRATAQLQVTRATIPPLESSIQVAIHRLAVLIGKNPDQLAATLSEPKPLPRYAGPIALGDPQSLLRRRPDIRSAERALAAATASIGVAVGDFFPKVSFIGTLGFEATTPANFGETGSDFYSFGPRITWPALDMGRVIARYNIAEAKTQEAAANYEQAVLGALEETESALVRFSKQRERRNLLKDAAANSAEASKLALIQYQEGGADFLAVLDAQRAELLAEGQLSESETQLALSLVAIYKALGGGWEVSELIPSSKS